MVPKLYKKRTLGFVHSKGRLLLPRSAAAGFGRISLVLRPSPGAIDGLEGWICVHDAYWPQPRETSSCRAPFQLQLGAGIIRKFFEKGKTQDIE
jgi:hypothetical protein